VGITVISLPVALMSWYQTNLAGVQRLTTADMILFVSIGFATIVTALLERLNPHWYRS
jgi:hypothetical protein